MKFYIYSTYSKELKFLKHVTASIYISFGFLFYYLQGFDGFYKSETMYIVIFLFFLTGVVYLISGLKDLIKK